MSGQRLGWLVYPFGEGPQYPLNKRLVGSQNPSGCFEEKKSFDPA
jgi:hypothetical protein